MAKEPGLNSKHRDSQGRISTNGKPAGGGSTKSSPPKVSSDRVGRAFDSASRNTGAFLKKK